MSSGAYADYSEALSAAILNLAVLHADLATKDAVVFGTEVPMAAKTNAMRSTSRRGPGVATAVGRPERAIPALFSLSDGSRPCAATLPADAVVKGDRIPLEKWIFGQYNRILPVKATCRALANILVERGEGVAIEDAVAVIVSGAAELGDVLSRHDKRFDIHRDEALSTAFPTSGIRAEKSRLRFRNQFIASTTGGGQLIGLPVELKLLNYVDGSKKHLALTSAGWDFALLRNPVLDGEQEAPGQKFFPEEQELLLAHIRQNVRVEDGAYRTILEFMRSGISSPSDLDKALRTTLSADAAPQIRDSFVTTQRSGAISRMTDAGLIDRVRDGVKMAYVATEQAAHYLNAN